MSFSNYLFADFIYNSITFNWYPYYFFTCVITNKIDIFLIERFWKIHHFLTWFFQHSSYTSQFFWRTTHLSIIINLKIWFHRFIFRCCMWSIFYSRIKISINPHKLWSFSISKSISNGILNVHNIIIIEYGFKLMSFPYIYCNAYYVKIWFKT